ncbi:cellulose binding domain-containing protein [Streptomyces sp. KL116D]|uniref:cellulose binding domain-containing protein n=1 Tax=Streptomyces sp. KL116D TaxID=3045152 RepID=UPI00355837E3
MTTLLLPAAALVGLATPSHAAAEATAVTATYAKTQDWGSGFEGKWTIKNSGTTAVSSWTVE